MMIIMMIMMIMMTGRPNPHHLRCGATGDIASPQPAPLSTSRASTPTHSASPRYCRVGSPRARSEARLDTLEHNLGSRERHSLLPFLLVVCPPPTLPMPHPLDRRHTLSRDICVTHTLSIYNIHRFENSATHTRSILEN